MFKVKTPTSAIFLTALVLTLVSCTQNSNKPKFIPLLQDSADIISTRTQNQKPYITILKLKTAPLLASATHDKGVTQVDAKLAAQITQEQDQLIAELKKLSSEIQVVYRYKYVLNAVCVVTPDGALDKFNSDLIQAKEKVSSFDRPKSEDVDVKGIMSTLAERNSAKFIGAEKLNQEGLTGKGMRIGVIDTGIDYTHSFFKGVGTAEAYKSVDPAKEALGFPNDRVRGGIDLVGTDYNVASENWKAGIPKPDLNPIDEAGHGSHVAGTIGGIGDGVNSYNGVAPEADLYAIKVFGAVGSTTDMVVIAALEYSVDPNGDGDLRDQLDVVNLSLGGGYGNPKILYSEAIKNLVNGGTLAVISAGNSGPLDYIVGSPSTTTESISVAASVDNTDHNWQFQASELNAAGENILVKSVEAATTKKVALTNVNSEMVYIGLAAVDLTPEVAAKVSGKVALIDRGQVSFNDKIKRAQAAGAIGVVMANNASGDPIVMGTTDTFDFPAIMVTQDVGTKLKAALASGKSAAVIFNSKNKILTPEIIDTITSFSSKGPRSIDGHLKPEISAPGFQVISAAFGQGNAVVKFSGTSMAAPHVAGVAALVKQSFKNRGVYLSALELKNVLMGTAITIGDKNGRYPVTLQGSGRIQADVAAHSELVAEEPSVSFGEINIEAKKVVKAAVHLRNLGVTDKKLHIEFVGNEFIQLNSTQDITLKGSAISVINLNLTLDATKMKDDYIREMDGWILVKQDGQEVYRIPVLAVAHKLSAIAAKKLSVLSTVNDSEGALVQLQIKNAGQNAGEAFLFNLISTDSRKPLPDAFHNADCDLQSIGYKIIEKADDQGKTDKFLQFGVKIYKPITNWQECDISVLVDANKDGVIEQEILGSDASSIPGQESGLATTLIDTIKAKEIRKNYETALDAAIDNPVELAKLKESYTDALIEQNQYLTFNNSTVAIMETRISNLSLDELNRLNFKVVVTHNQGSEVQYDDYLTSENKTFSISTDALDQSFTDLQEQLILNPLASLNLDLTKGRGQQSLLILMPRNKISFSDSLQDSQSQVVKPVFTAP